MLLGFQGVVDMLPSYLVISSFQFLNETARKFCNLSAAVLLLMPRFFGNQLNRLLRV